jgi:TonB family protein
MKLSKLLYTLILFIVGTTVFAQSKTPIVTEIQISDTTLIIGNTNNHIIFIHKHINFTFADTSYFFYLEDKSFKLNWEYYNGYRGAQREQVEVLFKTITALKESISESKYHNTKILIEGDGNWIHAEANYQISTGQWISNLYFCTKYLNDLSRIEINQLLIVIKKALLLMPNKIIVNEDTITPFKKEINQEKTELGNSDNVEISEDKKPYLTVQEMPQFVQGNRENAEAAMMKYLIDNMVYPLKAKEENIEGIVRVSFTVSETGVIKDARILNKDRFGYGLEEEALRVVLSMHKWVPGRQNGKNVPVYYNVPIRFRLN